MILRGAPEIEQAPLAQDFIVVDIHSFPNVVQATAFSRAPAGIEPNFGHPHLEWPQLRQVMQPSIITMSN